MKISKKSGALLATTAAVMLMSGAVSTPASAAQTAFEACLGVNACKGKGACKGAHNACKGKNACKGRGYVKMSKAQCEAVGGILGTEVFSE